MAKKNTSAAVAAEHYPSLRSALWLYLAALIGTGVILSFAPSLELVLLNLLAVLVVCGGLALLALFVTDVRPARLLGNRPARRSLIVSILAGLAVWIPASWLQVAVYGYITAVVGPLSQPLPTSAAPWSILLQSAIIIPLVEGFLFWGYIQRAAEGLGRRRGAILAAILYAVYVTLLSRDVGVSALPGLLIVGLVAAFATYFTGSAWCGIAVIAGYGAGSPVLENALFDYLGTQFMIQFGWRWLLIVAISLFLAFVLIQSLRVIGPGEAGIDTRRERPKLLWWVPLLISLVFVVLVTYGEYGLRVAQRSLREGSTTPGSIVQPVAPPPQPSPVASQPPQSSNQ